MYGTLHTFLEWYKYKVNTVPPSSWKSWIWWWGGVVTGGGGAWKADIETRIAKFSVVMSFPIYICESCPCIHNFLCDKSNSLSWQTRSSFLVLSTSPASSFSSSYLASSIPASIICLHFPQFFKVFHACCLIPHLICLSLINLEYPHVFLKTRF